jgi:hypothetical protein
MIATRRPVMSAFIGAFVGAAASFLFFVLLTQLDNATAGESIVYGVGVGIIGAMIGFMIGLIVGSTNVGILGGGLIGLGGIVLALAGFLMLFGGDDPVRALKSNWRVIALVLGPPSLITGLLTAWLKKRR